MLNCVKYGQIQSLSFRLLLKRRQTDGLIRGEVFYKRLSSICTLECEVCFEDDAESFMYRVAQ